MSSPGLVPRMIYARFRARSSAFNCLPNLFHLNSREKRASDTRPQLPE
jgi:hypothetical protein